MPLQLLTARQCQGEREQKCSRLWKALKALKQVFSLSHATEQNDFEETIYMASESL